MAKTVIIKKYSNRRLYDSEESRYITLLELQQKIRSGVDVRVVDAKTGEDLTQPTLVQIILDGRGAGTLLPVPLLLRLIRMGDDALAEFFGRYVTGALDLYLQARSQAGSWMGWNPFAGGGSPFPNPLNWAQSWGHGGPRGPGPNSAPTPVDAPVEDATAAQQGDDVARLREELEELKSQLNPQKNKRKKTAGKPRKKRAKKKHN